MRHIPVKVIIIQSLVLLIGIIAYAFNNTVPHQFKEEQCGFCHINYESPLQFRDNITTLCNYCHGKRNVLSHTVGVRPSMLIPADFHLDSNGEVTCATCHDIHTDAVDPVTGERTYLLRTNKKGREFCDSCHIITAEVVHSDTFDAAHFGYYTGGTSSVDRVSIYCLDCHDGSVGSHVSSQTKIVASIGASHPIGMDYLKSFNKSQNLRAPRYLNTGIKLFEGKVGCPSCHNPFNLEKFKLSIINEGSGLCFECHMT